MHAATTARLRSVPPEIAAGTLAAIDRALAGIAVEHSVTISTQSKAEVAPGAFPLRTATTIVASCSYGASPIVYGGHAALRGKLLDFASRYSRYALTAVLSAAAGAAAVSLLM